MVLSAKKTDRLCFGALYLLVAVLTLYGGGRMVNRGLDFRFLKDYLLRWEVCMHALSAQQEQWPVFSGTNHAAYMNRLTVRMNRFGIQVPASNTAVAYQYRIENFFRADEDIFVLCLQDRMVLYGVSDKVLAQLDRAVDNHSDLSRGRIIGRPGKNQGTFIGQWIL